MRGARHIAPRFGTGTRDSPGEWRCEASGNRVADLRVKRRNVRVDQRSSKIAGAGAQRIKNCDVFDNRLFWVGDVAEV